MDTKTLMIQKMTQSNIYGKTSVEKKTTNWPLITLKLLFTDSLQNEGTIQFRQMFGFNTQIKCPQNKRI